MSELLRVLQVEDSAGDAALVQRWLTKGGFRVEALRVEDAGRMRAALAEREWDIVIADYRLPQFSAPAALALLQETGRDLPFIVVSGTIGEENAVALMKAGANDYLMKDNLTRLAPTVAREVAEARRREEGRRTKAELGRSQALLTALTAGTTDAIYVKDAKGRYGLYNAGAASAFGIPATEALGRDDTALWPAREAGEVMATDRRIMAGGCTETVEEQLTVAGNRRAFLSTKGPMRDAEGRVTGLFGISRDITDRKAMEEHLRRSHDELRALAARLQTVREEQSTHIAREIHDVLGQQLTALKLDLVWLKRRAGTAGEAALAASMGRKIAATSELVDAAIKTVQKIATELRPGILEKLGLAAAVAQEVRDFGSWTGLPCEFESAAAGVELSPERATGVFRILQEALTNVARHARAATVRVRLASASDGLTLEVADDGRGIPPEELAGGRSLGLLGMHERARLLGGQLDIRGEDGRGTTVRLRVPLASPPCES
ncbi:MAG: response regulator [Verrucomicrobia bacterium]|nr:response regulator [Verrucomicrobiota bacterium]